MNLCTMKGLEVIREALKKRLKSTRSEQKKKTQADVDATHDAHFFFLLTVLFSVDLIWLHTSVPMWFTDCTATVRVFCLVFGFQD